MVNKMSIIQDLKILSGKITTNPNILANYYTKLEVDNIIQANAKAITSLQAEITHLNRNLIVLQSEIVDLKTEIKDLKNERND